MSFGGFGGGTRSFAKGMGGTQAGDPEQAAATIDAALRAEATPLRLQLGADAIDAVRAHSEQLLKDLPAWEAIARATSVDLPA